MVAIVLITVKRPRTCPLLLLSYFVTVLITKYLAANQDRIAVEVSVHYASLGAAGAACCIILLMPFQEQSATSSDISAVGQQPDSAFRSPEDNLRLWQFLSVSWMAPLISTGKHRQLNEPDVWYLPFEFQHKKLDERFRQLKGSVVRRLLHANGIDVAILILIAIVQMICSMPSFYIPTVNYS